jgi:hypothetical protein
MNSGNGSSQILLFFQTINPVNQYTDCIYLVISSDSPMRETIDLKRPIGINPKYV